MMRKLLALLALCLMVGAVGATITTNTLSYVPMNGTGTTLYDIGYYPNGHNPAVHGNAALSQTKDPKFGGASIVLDGSGDYISMSNSIDFNLLHNGTQSWSLAFWENRTRNANDNPFFDTSGGSSSYHGLYYSLTSTGATKIQFMPGDGNSAHILTVTETMVPPLSVWNYRVISYNATSKLLTSYINGTSGATQDMTSWYALYGSGNNYQAYIGAFALSSPSSMFAGQIDDFVIENKTNDGAVPASEYVGATAPGTDIGGNKNLIINSTLVYSGTQENWAAGGIQLPNGSYIISWEHSPSEMDNSGVCLASLSDNFGATWSSPYTIASDASYACWAPQFGVFNNTVLFFYGISDGADNNPTTQYVKISSDGGTSWGSPITISSGTGYNLGDQNPIQLISGRIVFPTYDINSTSGKWEGGIYYSDNNGTSWSAGGKMFGSDNFVEPSVVQLGDQSLLATLRNYLVALHVYKSISTDNGTTWSTPVATDILSDDSQSAAITDQYGHQMIVWDNVSSASQVRHPLTIGLSVNNMTSIFSYSDINATANHYSNLGIFLNKTGTAVVPYTDETNWQIYVAQINPIALMNYSIPAADFTSNVSSGVIPFPVQFTDTSLYSPNQWNWSFGDGTYSTSQNPDKTYSSDGVYTVTLTASNTSGNTTITRPSWITASPLQAPIASFACTPTSTTLGTPIDCTDTSSGTPTNWTYYWGDGNVTDGTQNPSYTYPFTGTFSINQTVNNTIGSSWYNRSNYITITNVTSFTQQDIYLTGQYTITFNVKSSTTNLPIANVTVVDSVSGQSYPSTNGTAFLTLPAGLYYVNFIADGYQSKQVTYVVDQDETHEVKMVPAETPNNPVYNVYPPKDVKFHITSFFGAPVVNASVTIQGITTSTGNWDWVITLLGISLDEVAINGTAMTETTDSNGDAVFLMLPSVKYNITTVADGYTFPTTILAPQATEYTITANWNESWFSSGNDTLKDVNVSVSWVKFNDTHSFVNITYDDQTMTTTGGTITVYRDSVSRVANASAISTMDITAPSCSNSTLVNTPTGGASYKVQVNATTTSGENVVRTFTHSFKGAPVTLPGWTPETLLWLSLFIIIFTAAFAGALHAPQMSVILCVEAWVFWSIGWMDYLISWNGYAEGALLIVLTVATFFTVIWSITEGKAKGKRSS